MNARDKELARQAGFFGIPTDKWVFIEILKNFADLIRADECEACANVCAEQGELKGYGPLECAKAILARGNT